MTQMYSNAKNCGKNISNNNRKWHYKYSHQYAKHHKNYKKEQYGSHQYIHTRFIQSKQVN